MKIPLTPVLSFQQAVPRNLVHRLSIAEVFVTDVLGLPEGSYLVAAQWPRWHVFYGSVTDTYDSALIAETLRQATILIAHTQLGVPLGKRFLLPHMEVTKSGVEKPLAGKPTDATIVVRVTDEKSGRHGPTGFDVSAEFQVEDTVIATASAGAKIVDEATYTRLRRHRVDAPCATPPPGLSEAIVGCSPRNVALAELSTGRSWILRTDTTNPIYFDHPLDHVPGALLIEAARQCIRVVTGEPRLDVRSFAAVFVKMVELEGLTTVSVASLNLQKDGTTSALIEIKNSGQELLTRIDAVVALRTSEDLHDAFSVSRSGESPEATSLRYRRPLEQARG